MKCQFRLSYMILTIALSCTGMSCKIVNGSSRGGSNGPPPSYNFYAHCTTSDLTHEIDVVGTTGYAGTSGYSGVDGYAVTNQNTSMCANPWTAYKVRPVLIDQREELNIFTENNTDVLLDIDFTSYHNSATASAWQTNALVESGALFGTVMSCRIYSAVKTPNYCDVGQTTLVSCPNLAWEICGNL